MTLDPLPKAKLDRPFWMTGNQEHIEPAQLDWRDGQAISDRFQDIYYSADGEQEVQRVFAQPSHLIDRANESSNLCFTIGELGFGTGLNFTVCADTLLPQTSKILHFISVEGHPLRPDDWRRVAQLRPDSKTAQTLALTPPPLLTGWHRRSFHHGRVHLSIFHGDVDIGLQELEALQREPIDAWFLDGFAPDKNPAMWSPRALAAISRLSTTGTTVATFTAKGQARRDLAACGFAMEKIDQRPFKRTSLFGRFIGEGAKTRYTPPSTINVLGAGVAGAWAARQLAELGLKVNVFDPHGIASGGSKMNVSALHARLLGDQTPTAEFRARAFHHATALLHHLPAFRQTGALQLALNEQELAKIRRIHGVYCSKDDTESKEDQPAQPPWLEYQEPDQLREMSRIEAMGGLFFKQAGVVDLPLLCRSLLDHSAISVRTQTRKPGDDENWIIACGSSSRDFCAGVPVEIGDVWGQLDWIEPTDAHLPVPIVGNGYAIPGNNAWVVGSSYEQRPWPPAQATTSNIEANRRFIGDGEIVALQYKRAARCVSSDRDPVIGQLTQQRWISTAHGSSGTSSAPLAATIIVSDIMGWVPPVSPRALASIDPRRFIARQARRGVKVVGPG